MSMFVTDTGSFKIYAVVNPQTETVITTFWGVGRESVQGMKALEDAGHVGLVMHNITHPKCPDWLKKLVRSDKQYCECKAVRCEQQAASLRKKAAAMLQEANDYDQTASDWRNGV